MCTVLHKLFKYTQCCSPVANQSGHVKNECRKSYTQLRIQHTGILWQVMCGVDNNVMGIWSCPERGNTVREYEHCPIQNIINFHELHNATTNRNEGSCGTHVSSCNHFNDYQLKGFHHPDNWPKSVLKKDDRFLAEWRSVERHLQTTPKDKAKVLVTVVQGYSLPQAHTTTVCIPLVICRTNFLGIQKILLDTWEYC